MTDNIWDGLLIAEDPVMPKSGSRSSSEEDGPERILARMEQDAGTRLSGAARDSALSKIRNGDFDISFPKSTNTDLWHGLDVVPDDTPVGAPAAATPAPTIPEKAAPTEEGGFWSGRLDAVKSDLSEIGQIGSTALGGIEKVIGSASFNLGRSENPIVTASLRAVPVIESLWKGDLDGAIKGITSDSATVGEDIAAGMYKRAEGNVKEGEELRAKLEDRDWLSRELGGGVIDAAGSPTSALSLVGGPAGALVMADVYSQSYYQARQKGVPADQAEIYAASQAIPEAISMIPAGKFLERAPILGPILKKRAAALEAQFAKDGLFKKLVDPNIQASLNMAKTAVGESTEEVTSGSLQDMANVFLAGQDKAKELSSFAKEQAPLNKDGSIDWNQFGANRYRDARAGALMGAGGSIAEAPHIFKNAKAEEEARVGQLQRSSLEHLVTNVDQRDAQAGMDVADQAAELDKETQKDRAFSDNSTQYSAEQKAAEEEAAQRTIERQRTADKLSQNPALNVAPVTPVTPEEVQKEWESQATSEDERLKRVELGSVAERVRARQSVAAKAAEVEAAAQADTARKAEIATKRLKTAHENKVTDEIIAANPGMDAADLAPKVQEALKANPFVAPAPKVEVAPVAKEAPAKGKRRRKVAAAPVVAETTTAAPVAAPAATAPAGPVVPGTQSELSSLDAQLGLSPAAPASLKMANAESATTPDGKLDPESFAGKHLRALKALVSRNTQTSTDVQNLTKQGKIIFAPNAKSIGRDDHSDPAEYDTGEGKMYIYLDHANPDDVAGILVRALHESTHAGQFTGREGRASIYQHMMSKEAEGSASRKIREAAKAGNKLAQRAVEAAEKAGDVEHLELVPYFVGEVVQAREGSTLGRLGGVATDIRQAGRKFLRNGLGVNLDLSLNDIHAAAMGVAGEAVKTNIKGVDGSGSLKDDALKMVGSRSGKGFAKAKAEGRTWIGPDDKERYEIDDSDAEVVMSDASKADLLAGKKVPISDIWSHPELDSNYPNKLDNLQVRIDPTLPKHEAMYTGGHVAISKSLLDDHKALNEILAHEVGHNIQAEEGLIRGTAPEVFLVKETSKARRAVDYATRDLELAEARFPLGIATTLLPERIQKTYDARIARMTSRADKVNEFVVNGFADNVAPTGPGMGRHVDMVKTEADKYKKAIDAKQEATQVLQDLNKKAADMYYKHYGEAEQFNVMRRMGMSDESRKAAPFESTLTDGKGGKPADMSKYMGRDAEQVPVSLKMSNPAKVTNTPEFKGWFKASKVVNEDGSPRIMYHGTRAQENFEAWRKNPGRDLGMHFGTVGQANNNRFVDSTNDANTQKDQYGFAILPSRIIPVYLSLQNPLRINEDVFGVMNENSLEALRKTGVVPKATLEELQQHLMTRDADGRIVHYGDRGLYVLGFEKAIRDAGYDGIVYKNTGEPSYVEYGLDEDGNIDPYNIIDVVHDDSYIVFEPTQIKSAIGNNGQFDPSNPSILKMAAAANSPSLPFTRRIPPTVSAFLSSSAGAGKIAREIIEHAVASPAGERMIAEGTVGAYRDGIEALAKQRGISTKALNKEIADKLDAIDARENDYDVNLQAFIDVARQYGPAGEALIKFRNQTDQLSFQMLRERAAQGTPLTTAEVDTYTTLRNNLGRYSHRSYASQMGKGGKKFAKTLFQDYEKYNKAGGVGLSQSVQDNHKLVADAVKLIVDDHLMIPDDDGLMELTPVEVKRLFDVYGGKSNPEAYSLSQQRSILSDMRDGINANTDVMTATAEDIVRDIVGLVAPKSPIAQIFKGGKVDRSILKERAWISPEIRAVMGEIRDPAMRLFSTVAKQTEFIARSRMLLELRDNMEPTHLQPPGPSGRKEVRGMTQLKGEEYGPLSNYFVSENLATLLSSHIQQLATFEQAVAMAITRPTALGTLAASSAVQTWGKLAGKAKMLQIVGKPINFAINFMGGPRSMLLNGNLNPAHLLKAMSTASSIIAYSIDPSKSNAESRRVTSVGITDSAFVGEINSEVYHELNKLVREMQGKSNHKVLEAINKWAILAPKEAYAMMDVVYKIANFYQIADAVLPQYYAAEGVDKTQAQIDREAADITNGTNVTYKRAAPIIKNLERYGITQFGTFFYEVFRSEVNNVRQGFAELERGKNSTSKKGAAIMYMQGGRRLVGQLTAWTATGMLSSMLAKMVFGDDEDKEKKLRALLPDYLQNQDFVIFGKDKDGKSVLFDWSRIDPSGPITDIMRTVLNQGGDFEKLQKDVIDLYVAPRLGTRIIEAVAATAGSTKKQQEPLLQEKFPDAFENILDMTRKIGLSDNATKAWTLVGETFLPGIAGSWTKSNARPVMEDVPSTIGALSTYMGARMYVLDNPRALNSKAFDHRTSLKDNRAEISQYFDNHPNATLDGVINELGEKRDREYESFQKLQATYDGMLAIGHTPQEVAVLLKKSKISKDVIKDLSKGEFQFRSLSKKSVDGFKKNELIGKTLEEKRQIQEKWKNATALLDAGKEQLDEEN